MTYAYTYYVCIIFYGIKIWIPGKCPNFGLLQIDIGTYGHSMFYVIINRSSGFYKWEMINLRKNNLLIQNFEFKKKWIDIQLFCNFILSVPT